MKLTDFYRDLGSIRSNRVVRNASALMIAQGANYLLPLASVPFLIHALGAKSYGILAFAQALTAFFSLAVGYGFGVNVTREIAENQSNREYVASLTASVLLIKVIFSLVGFGILICLALTVPTISENWLVFVAAYTSVFFGAFVPRWAFQGLEVMRPIAIIDTSTRAFGIVLVFIFIRQPDDVAWAAFFLTSGSIVAAVAFTLYLVLKLNVRFALPDFSLGIRQVKEGWIFFLATAGATLFNQGNVVMLGFMMPPSYVGIYAAAEKIVKAASTVNVPIGQSVFPHAMKLMREDRDAFVSFARRLLWLQPLFLIVPSACLLFGAYWISHHLLGIDDPRAEFILMIMSLLPLSQAVADVLGNIVMIGFGYKKEFTRLFLMAGMLNVVLLVLLSSAIGILGAACSVVCAEMALLAMRWRFVSRRGLLSTSVTNMSRV